MVSLGCDPEELIPRVDATPTGGYPGGELRFNRETGRSGRIDGKPLIRTLEVFDPGGWRKLEAG